LQQSKCHILFQYQAESAHLEREIFKTQRQQELAKGNRKVKAKENETKTKVNSPWKG
jgi:hypothetical protein